MELISTHIADIAFVLVGALIILDCTRNGFVKCLFKFVRTILALTLAYFLVAPVAPIIAENFIEEPIYNYVYGEIDSIYASAEENLNADELFDKLPESLRTEAMEEKLNNIENSGEELVESFSEAISNPIVSVVSSVIAFVLLFIVLFILLSIVMRVLNALVERIRLIDLANKILGFVWGSLVAIIVWTVLAALMELLFKGIPFYDDSVVIKFFAETNIFEVLGIWDLIEDWMSSADFHF